MATIRESEESDVESDVAKILDPDESFIANQTFEDKSFAANESFIANDSFMANQTGETVEDKSFVGNETVQNKIKQQSSQTRIWIKLKPPCPPAPAIPATSKSKRPTRRSNRKI
ncbi:hypothetical protein PtB15_16B28 [Puccinia triticina]|nr:hypothetical protein PtB15_16B28 [Puccinia triticina]